jgi:pyruvate/2-oxoglutarate dehydrogenase complex dihydrolipoamide dehydrogenase (E3) component
MDREDPDVADEVQRILSDEGIQVLVAAKGPFMCGRSGEVILVVRDLRWKQNIEGSDILVAAGRIPNTAGIGLEGGGVELDGRGIFALMSGWRQVRRGLGDRECASSPQFTRIRRRLSDH